MFTYNKGTENYKNKHRMVDDVIVRERVRNDY